MKDYSRTYTSLLELLIHFGKQAVDNQLHRTNINGTNVNSEPTGINTQRLQQAVTICDLKLFVGKTNAQIIVLTRIISELKEYNALWYCSKELKRSRTTGPAINQLIEMDIIIPTETRHIYLVNPLHIRRGDLFMVLATTANMLRNKVKVLSEHITDKKKVREFSLEGNNSGISGGNGVYGYNEDGIIDVNSEVMM